MNLQEIIEKSLESRALYEIYEKEHFGRIRTPEEIYTTLVSDVGDLGRLVLAREQMGDIDNLDQKLKHELAECLINICVFSKKYNINLEEAFLLEIKEIEKKVKI